MAYKYEKFTGALTSTLTILHGFAVHENAGTAAVASFTIDDGASDVVIPVELAANESAGMSLVDGLKAATAWRVANVTGTIRGSLWGY
jgi:hypothetical protein